MEKSGSIEKIWFVRKLGKSGKILLPKEVIERFRGKYVVIEIKEFYT